MTRMLKVYTSNPTLRVVALAVVLGLVASCSSGPAGLSGVVRDPAPYVGSAALPDVTREGEPFRFVAPSDGILVVNFGYTYCPDVCPATMAHIRSAVEELGPEGSRVTVAFVTVDPGRDTPEWLAEYVGHFAPGGHALRTEDPEALRESADVFGADYSVRLEGTKVLVEHTADLYAVDDQGLVRVIWPFGSPWQDIAADLSILLKQEASRKE